MSRGSRSTPSLPEGEMLAAPKCKYDVTNVLACPQIKCTFESGSGERYRCDYCGMSVWIDYEEIR